MKPSDEQVTAWAQEWEAEYRRLWTEQASVPAMRGALLAWEWFGRKDAYIAHKACEFGRESMREEAAKRCKSVADCYGENVNNPNLGVTGQKAMLHKQAAAMDCYNAIRNLPISEEGEHSND